MNRGELLTFLRRHRLCVQASVSDAGSPQAAVVGFAVSDDLEIVFDTIGTTRKMTNLRRDARVALVVGWDEEQTVQIEGVADEPKGAELERLKNVYFGAYPDGVDRQSWKDITYVRVRPTWVRYSDFRPGGSVVELSLAELHLPIDSRVHHELLHGIVRDGAAPTLDELRGALGASQEDIAASLRRLNDNHGLVLHPGTTDPCIVHPFSLSPTAVWVATEQAGWWAPCIWCATGIVTLAAPTGTVHARLGGEAEVVTIGVGDGKLLDEDLVVHFAIPPRDAWKNVVHYCSTVLPFRHEKDVEPWCDRHRLPRGAVVPLRQVLDLGRAWYGRHLARDWVKWTTREAQAIFDGVGLRGEFWRLPTDGERF